MSATRALYRTSAFLQTGRVPAAFRCSSSSAGQKKDGASQPPAVKPTASVGSVKPPLPPPQKAAPPPPVPKVEFDNSKYQATEYFGYNSMSYYDFEVQMAKNRLPQQSCLKR